MTRFLKEFESFCEKAEELLRYSQSTWQFSLLILHLWRANEICISVGGMIYFIFQTVILFQQLWMRLLKCINPPKILKLQKIVCVLHLLNFLPLFLIALQVNYFQVGHQIAFKLLQFYAIFSTFYYVFIVILLISLFLSRHSSTGIRDAILVKYQEIKLKKWLQVYHPQESFKEITENYDRTSDVSSDKGESSSEENSDCAICLDKFDSEQMVCQLQCKHYYHLNCIYKWLEKDSSKKVCPICNQPNRLIHV